MHIDEYQFGRMVVDGKAYRKDLILLPDGVRSDWWREEGHSLGEADLADVFAAKPEVLVVGTGAHGVMGVSPEARRALERAGIQVIVEPTGEAVGRYNALAAGGMRVAGAFHLTC
ncbi:MAG: Mth938-like domain-containing protein [Phycisphaerae bacterium]|nr:Mth938-like domain-containing protein [Phycisphaerae bacterium]